MELQTPHLGLSYKVNHPAGELSRSKPSQTCAWSGRHHITLDNYMIDAYMQHAMETPYRIAALD
jgi:hypothetical protein